MLSHPDTISLNSTMFFLCRHHKVKNSTEIIDIHWYKQFLARWASIVQIKTSKLKKIMLKFRQFTSNLYK